MSRKDLEINALRKEVKSLKKQNEDLCEEVKRIRLNGSYPLLIRKSFVLGKEEDKALTVEFVEDCVAEKGDVIRINIEHFININEG